MDFIDLKTQYKRIEKSLDPKLKDIMSNARFIMGAEVIELESQLARYTGRKHCISCSSGTDALVMPLMASGIGKGDAVFVPTFTFFSTAEVVSFVGATPIFVDVYEDTFNIDTEKLEEAIRYIKEKSDLTPKAVIPVDLFGQPAKLPDLQNICDSHNLILIEDAAQGFGGSIGDRRACSFGDFSSTSFFPAKPLGCYGDGGAVFTDNDEYAGLLKSIRVHGQGQGDDKYSNVRIGINGRLDTIQAAVLLEKLKIFDDEIIKKNEIAQKYTSRLSDYVKTPCVNDGYYSSWAQYTIVVSANKREKVAQALKENEIPTAIYYKKPIHTLDIYKELEYIKHMNYGVSEKLSETVLSLPMHAYLQDEDINLICQTIAKA